MMFHEELMADAIRELNANQRQTIIGLQHLNEQMLAALQRARTVMCVEGENDLEEWRSVLADVEAAILKAGGEL